MAAFPSASLELAILVVFAVLYFAIDGWATRR